jgi:Protein of unknown function (DUF3224)
MTQLAAGTFEVKTLLQPTDEAGGVGISRLLLDKQFHGALNAKSQGQMLSFRSQISGSAGYVAMELVDGFLEHKKGTFVLQHSGSMNRGAPELTLSVVPDSGTQGLTGLRGTMQISIEGDQHRYRFEFSFAD